MRPINALTANVGIDFRTAAGRQRYEDILRMLREVGQPKK